MPNQLQPDHTQEDTRVLLVHGWRCGANFEGPRLRDQLAALEQAIEPSGGAFVVAQSLVYVDGEQEVVIGLPVAAAHADAGPVEWSLDDARAIEARTDDAFTPGVRAALGPLLTTPLEGEPGWLLVPTGALASGYLAFGRLVETPEERDYNDQTLICGCDMSQEKHAQAVRGELVAQASDWDIDEVDLSAERIDGLRAKNDGKLYVIARYD